MGNNFFDPPTGPEHGAGINEWPFISIQYRYMFYHVIIKNIFGGAYISNLSQVSLAVVNLVSLLLPYGYMYIKVYICVCIAV